MEEAVEQIVESALLELLNVVLAFIVANIAWLLLAVLVLAIAGTVAILYLKRKIALKWWKKASVMHNDSAAQLNALISSGAIKGLDQGFVQGKTERALSQLEERLFALHRRSEQLRLQLAEWKAPLFSFAEPLIRANKLKRDVNEFKGHLERLRQNISNVAAAEKDTIHAVRQAGIRLASTAQELGAISKQTGYPLDLLNRELNRVQHLFREAESASAFDVVLARSQLPSINEAIDSLTVKVAELRKQLTIFEQMRTRIQSQLEQLALSNSAATTMSNDIERILQRHEQSLRLGQQTNLRSAAGEIEQIISDAFEHTEREQSQGTNP